MSRNGSTQNAGYMKQASPLIHWLADLEPHNVDVFVHNEGWIDAPPDIVWANLIDAAQWPSWYSNSADVGIEGGQSKLSLGVSQLEDFRLPDPKHCGCLRAGARNRLERR